MASYVVVPQIKIEADFENLTINDWFPIGNSHAVDLDVKVEREPYTNDAKFAFDGTPIKQEPDDEDVRVKIEPSDGEDSFLSHIPRRRLIIHPPRRPAANPPRRIRLIIHPPRRQLPPITLSIRRRLAELERKRLGKAKFEPLGRIIARARRMLAMGRKLEQMTIQEPVPQRRILPGEARTRSEHVAARQERLRQERVVMQSGLPLVRLP